MKKLAVVTALPVLFPLLLGGCSVQVSTPPVDPSQSKGKPAASRPSGADNSSADSSSSDGSSPGTGAAPSAPIPAVGSAEAAALLAKSTSQLAYLAVKLNQIGQGRPGFKAFTERELKEEVFASSSCPSSITTDVFSLSFSPTRRIYVRAAYVQGAQKFLFRAEIPSPSEASATRPITLDVPALSITDREMGVVFVSDSESMSFSPGSVRATIPYPRQAGLLSQVEEPRSDRNCYQVGEFYSCLRTLSYAPLILPFVIREARQANTVSPKALGDLRCQATDSFRDFQSLLDDLDKVRAWHRASGNRLNWTQAQCEARIAVITRELERLRDEWFRNGGSNAGNRYQEEKLLNERHALQQYILDRKADYYEFSQFKYEELDAAITEVAKDFFDLAK